MGDKTDKGKSGSQTRHVPKDAQVIMSIMKDMAITDYEPRVINQLLEFTYRYVTCIMDDARVYANHAKKKSIDVEDVRIAVQMQVDKSFTTPPPREVLLEVARSKNIIPLPLVKPHCGLRLPPDRYCLSQCNYKLKPAMKKGIQKPALGSPIIKSAMGKGLTGPIVKRQGPMPMGPAKVGSAPKPVLKFSAGSKVVSKPTIRVTSGTSSTPGGAVKMEIDESVASKRKREDDYDVL